jgi:hypothetical protein
LLNGIRECGNRDGSILHSCFDVWWHWHMIHRIQSCCTLTSTFGGSCSYCFPCHLVGMLFSNIGIMLCPRLDNWQSAACSRSYYHR